MPFIEQSGKTWDLNRSVAAPLKGLGLGYGHGERPLGSKTQTYLSTKPPFVPFEIKRLPLICHLRNIGFYKYKSRWMKRLGKRIGRLIFEYAYHQLRLSGHADIYVQYGGQKRRFVFDSRKTHFSQLYDKQIYDLCEPELATLLELFLTGDKVFYDIGANWGYFSLYASSLPDYRGCIHAFEPVEETYADLQDWVTQLGQENRVICHKVALSDTDGITQIGIIPDHSGVASLARAEDMNSEKQVVQTCRLDGLGLPKPDFVKLDVEGHEYEAIQGGLDSLITNKPMIVVENWIDQGNSDHTLMPIRALLDCGYKLFVPMWWIGPPSNKMFWPESHRMFPDGPRQMAYVELDIDMRFTLRDQINLFCCHKDRLSELDAHFFVPDQD